MRKKPLQPESGNQRAVNKASWLHVRPSASAHHGVSRTGVRAALHVQVDFLKLIPKSRHPDVRQLRAVMAERLDVALGAHCRVLVGLCLVGGVVALSGLHTAAAPGAFHSTEAIRSPNALHHVPSDSCLAHGVQSPPRVGQQLVVVLLQGVVDRHGAHRLLAQGHALLQPWSRPPSRGVAFRR